MSLYKYIVVLTITLFMTSSAHVIIRGYKRNSFRVMSDVSDEVCLPTLCNAIYGILLDRNIGLVPPSICYSLKVGLYL